MCGVTRRTLLRWVDAGRLPSVATAGGHHRIAEGDMLAFLRTRQRGGAAKVAIVDDDAAHVEALRRVVLSLVEGAEVHFAYDGFGAGLLVASMRPDLLLLDLEMPLLDGESVVERMASRSELDRTAVVIVSGRLTDQRAERLRALGARDCLLKPVSPTRIEEVLRHFCPGHMAVP